MLLQPFLGALTHDPFSSSLAQAILLLALIRFLDLWERQPLRLVVLFALWGGFGATAIAYVAEKAMDPLLAHDTRIVWGAAIEAPLAEELSKGLALVAAFFASRWTVRRFGMAELDGPLDGIVYGAAIGLGFAFVEDNLYAVKFGASVLHQRLGFLGLLMLGHAIYTASFGAGLGLATWSATRAGQIGYPLLGLVVAMFLHALHDGLLQLVLVLKYGLHTTALFLTTGVPADLGQRMLNTADSAFTAVRVIDYVLVAMFFAALTLWVRYQRQILVYELSEEVNRGLITEAEWHLITSYRERIRWYAQLLWSGQVDRLRAVRRAHQQLTDLAFWKWRVQRVGGDQSLTDHRRQAISALRQEMITVPAAPAG
jgi:RsiW-degrading membrane proteinase PrsW (M82 family)